MHLRGRVRLQPWTTAEERCATDPEISDALTVIETDQRRILYEGVIFDATGDEIASNPALLDTAFGYYTYVRVEKHTGEIVMGTDRLGFSPLYYSVNGGTLRFASSISRLKRALDHVTPNMDAWDELLLLGDIIGEKTVVKEILRLQWGRKISITDGQMRLVSTWDPEVPAFSDRDAYIERNNALLQEAVRLTANVGRHRVIALTGGQDSRRLAAAARSVGIPFECATQEVFGTDNADKDVLIAQEVARALGARHIRVTAPASQVLQADRRLKDYWCGYESDYHAWAVNFVRNLKPGALIYDGTVGDVAVNGHFFRAHPAAISRYEDIDYLAERICGREKSHVSQSLLSGPVFERVRAELARLPASPHRLTFFFILNHTRRNIGSWLNLFGLFGHMPCTPYLYYPLFLQSLSLQPSAYLDRWMQNECLRALNPQLAQIPSTRNPVPRRYVMTSPGGSGRRAVRSAARESFQRDITRHFPGLAARHRANQFLGRLPLPGLGTRWNWASILTERFSEFLDWTEDTSDIA